MLSLMNRDVDQYHDNNGSNTVVYDEYHELVN